MIKNFHEMIKKCPADLEAGRTPCFSKERIIPAANHSRKCLILNTFLGKYFLRKAGFCKKI